jgi:hypothetical protein
MTFINFVYFDNVRLGRHLRFVAIAEAASSGTGTVDKMFDDLSLRFFGGKVGQRKNGAQHLTHVGRRKGWQEFDFELLA